MAVIPDPYTFAGEWAPGTFTVQNPSGSIIPAAGATVTLENLDASAAVCFTNRIKGGSATNVVVTDSNGNISPMFVDPGQYQYTVLDNTDVSHGPFAITIAQDAQEPTHEPVRNIAVVASGASTTLDLRNEAPIFVVAVDHATALVFGDPTSTTDAADEFTLILEQDGTGHAVTWPGGVLWPGGSVPTPTATASAKDAYAFFSPNGGSTWFGRTLGQAFAT